MSYLTQTPAWRALTDHRDTLARPSISALFEQDPERAERFSLEAAGLYVDYSKHPVVAGTLERLVALAREAGVEARRQAMFGGEPINVTEDRAVLHVALRDRSGRPRLVEGIDVAAPVAAVLEKMRRFSTAVRDGAWPRRTTAICTACPRTCSSSTWKATASRSRSRASASIMRRAP